MSRIATMARNFRQIKENHTPSETVMIAVGWEYTAGEYSSTKLLQFRSHCRRHGLGQFPLGRAFQPVKRRTWERLDVQT